MIRKILDVIAVCIGLVIVIAAIIGALTLMTSVTLSSGSARSACDLLDTALNEAQMAEAWYIETGEVLKRCGIESATERAERKACYARRMNDDSEVCE